MKPTAGSNELTAPTEATSTASAFAIYFPDLLGEPYYGVSGDSGSVLVPERTLEDAKVKATPSGGFDTTPLLARDAIMSLLAQWGPDGTVSIVRRFDRDWNEDRAVLLITLAAAPTVEQLSSFMARVARDVDPALMAAIHLDFTVADAHPAS